MRVIIFDQMGSVLSKFSCSKHLEFPNGVVVNDREEIFISDNRAHCVKVCFNIFIIITISISIIHIIIFILDIPLTYDFS